MIVFNERIAGWVAAKIGLERGFASCQALGSLDADGFIIGGVVFHNWSPEHGTIELSAAGSGGWLTKRLINRAFEYVFEELDCQLAYTQQDESNGASRRVFLALGATETVIPRWRGRNTPGVLSTLTDDAWKASRFNEVNHGQAKRTRTNAAA